MRYKLNKKKFISFIAIIFLIVLVIWFSISYGEILGKNLNGNVELNNWNFFKIFGNIS